MSEIKDGVYGYVSGTVGKVFTFKGGDAAVVEVAREGMQYPDRVTAWGLSGVAEGDRVGVKGWISWRREVKDEKTYFNVSLNQPKLDKHEPAQGAVPDAWGGGSDDQPF